MGSLVCIFTRSSDSVQSSGYRCLCRLCHCLFIFSYWLHPTLLRPFVNSLVAISIAFKKSWEIIFSAFSSLLIITFRIPFCVELLQVFFQKWWHSALAFDKLHNNWSRTGHRLNHTENKRANVICKKKALDSLRFQQKSTVCSGPQKLNK